MQAGSGHIRPGPVPVAVASAPSAASCRMLRSLKSPWVRPWVVPKSRAAPGILPSGCRLPRQLVRTQLTLTADQAAATALYSVSPAPYRSAAARRVATQAPA